MLNSQVQRKLLGEKLQKSAISFFRIIMYFPYQIIFASFYFSRREQFYKGEGRKKETWSFKLRKEKVGPFESSHGIRLLTVLQT